MWVRIAADAESKKDMHTIFLATAKAQVGGKAEEVSAGVKAVFEEAREGEGEGEGGGAVRVHTVRAALPSHHHRHTHSACPLRGMQHQALFTKLRAEIEKRGRQGAQDDR